MASAKLSTKAAGSIIKLNLSGSPWDFRILNQGNPNPALYDSSCDGTWVCLEKIYSTRAWDSSDNDLKNSDIKVWMNGDFLNMFDPDIRAAIKQVKIPYVNGPGGSAVASGANGLSCKIFPLSGYELGWTRSDNSYFPVDGAKLDYFQSGTSSAANQKRIAKYNGSATSWWTRSPDMSYSNDVWDVNSDGSYGSWNYNGTCGVRPAFILPSELLVSDDGTVSTNEPPTAPGSIEVTGIVGGGSAAITLTAATDPDGTVESYRYERQVDGGAWTQFADTSSLSQTDAVSSEWGTVAYRACAVDDAGEAGPYATSQTETVNSGWIIISGPAENLGSKPGPFWFKCSSSITGPAAETTGISVVIGVDNEQKKSATVNAGDVVSHIVDTRLMSPGTHTIDVQATKDDYLPASQSYTFEVPALVLPDAAVIDFFQNPSAQAILPPTLLRLAIGRGGKDGQTLIDDIEKRVKALESKQS